MVTSEDVLKIKDPPLAHMKIFDISNCSPSDDMRPKYEVYTSARIRDVAMRAAFAMELTTGVIQITRTVGAKSKTFHFRVQESPNTGKRTIFRLW